MPEDSSESSNHIRTYHNGDTSPATPHILTLTLSASPQPDSTVHKPYDLPRLAIDSPIQAPKSTSFAWMIHLRFPVPPTPDMTILLRMSCLRSPSTNADIVPPVRQSQSKPHAPTRSLVFLVCVHRRSNPRSPCFPAGIYYLPLPPMEDRFAPALAHVSFIGLGEDTLPPLHAVFPAVFTPLAPAFSAPTAAHRCTSSPPHPGTKRTFPFTFHGCPASLSEEILPRLHTVFPATFTFPRHPTMRPAPDGARAALGVGAGGRRAQVAMGVEQPRTRGWRLQGGRGAARQLRRGRTRGEIGGLGAGRRRKEGEWKEKTKRERSTPLSHAHISSSLQATHSTRTTLSPAARAQARCGAVGCVQMGAEQPSAQGWRLAVTGRAGGGAAAAGKDKESDGGWGAGSGWEEKEGGRRNNDERKNNDGQGGIQTEDEEADAPVPKRFAGGSGASDVHPLLHSDADAPATSRAPEIQPHTDAAGAGCGCRRVCVRFVVRRAAARDDVQRLHHLRGWDDTERGGCSVYPCVAPVTGADAIDLKRSSLTCGPTVPTVRVVKSALTLRVGVAAKRPYPHNGDEIAPAHLPSPIRGNTRLATPHPHVSARNAARGPSPAYRATAFIPFTDIQHTLRMRQRRRCLHVPTSASVSTSASTSYTVGVSAQEMKMGNADEKISSVERHAHERSYRGAIA
ncbi:hypothetical protein B0H19DRAFT_1263569 [Mycena capillaripes]|nr:hypothetical protein B0H19DRAFT_1263569 [Mycena capillaripes]